MSEQEDGGIIDGRYSIGSADGLQDFVRVEVSICVGVSVHVRVEGGTISINFNLFKVPTLGVASLVRLTRL